VHLFTHSGSIPILLTSDGMPSPVGHLLAGAAVYVVGVTRECRARTLLAIALLGSIVPDFDFVPGILIGDMGAFHHGISHSLTFALLFGGLTLLVARYTADARPLQASLLAVLVYSAHVLLDFLNVNPGTRGVPLLWPLWHEQLGVNPGLFGRFRYGDITEGIWSVVRWDNVSPLFRELTILGSLLLILLRKEQIRRIVLALRTKLGTASGS
jgi:inner membrane protein